MKRTKNYEGYDVAMARQKFFHQLESIFVGQAIREHKDASGYTNLISIKTAYFNDIKPRIEKLAADNTSTIDMLNELYNRLYTFFESYLNDTGTPFFYKTEFFKNIYAPVYSEHKDVELFWKTKDLYYIKSDPLYCNECFVDGVGEGLPKEYTFDFVLRDGFTQSQGNEKAPLLQFHLLEADAQERVIRIQVSHKDDELQINSLPNLAPTNDEERKRVKDAFETCPKLDDKSIQPILAKYKRQAEIDYFIHKDAGGFLNEQLDIYLYNFLFNEKHITEWDAESIKKVGAFRTVAREIISYIAAFEDELKRIWEKPKLAKRVEYVITIDKFDDALRARIASSHGMAAQMDEWKELKMIEEDFTLADIDAAATEKRRMQYARLPVDTKHFPEIRHDILSHFDGIDDACDGVMIKSDNWQALNTILPKYRERVQCIYIDPPFNTGNDGFNYKDNFNHSSWLTFMRNRLEVARELMRDDGVIFVQCDDNEQAYLKVLMDDIFGRDNFVNTIIWKTKNRPQSDAKHLSANTDSIILFAKNKLVWRPGLLERTEKMDAAYKNPDDDPNGPWASMPIHAKSGSDKNIYKIEFPNGIVWQPPKGSYPRFSKERLLSFEAENRLIFKGENVRFKTYLNEVQQGRVYTSLWDELGSTMKAASEIQKLFKQKIFTTPKPEILIQRIIEISTQPSDIVLDYHLGSGTTAGVAHKMGRKYIGIEQVDYIKTIATTRLKKVVAGEQGGISKAVEWHGGGMVKYYELEQYEESLRNATYVMRTDEGGRNIIDMKLSEKLAHALRIEEGNRVTVDLHDLYPDCDIIESISNITGWKIKKYIDKTRATLDNNGVEVEIDTTCMVLREHPYLKPYLYWDSE